MLKFRHIFLAGPGRSGTTLLNGVIGSIPGVWMRGENHSTLLHLSNAAHAAVRAKELQCEPPYDIRHPFHGAAEIDTKEFRDMLVTAFVKNVLKPPPDALAIGFKEIRFGPVDMPEQEYNLFMKFIVENFERSCIVFNMRRHSAILRSGYWPSMPDGENALKATERRFRRTMEQHPECTFWVNYDEYKNDPGVLRPMFNFLGADFDAEKITAVFAIKHSY